MGMNKKFMPFGTRLLIERKEAEEVTAGGIVLPEQAQRGDKDEGVVITKGPDCSKLIQVGDTVLFMPFAGIETEISGKKYLVLLEIDIVGKLSPID